MHVACHELLGHGTGKFLRKLESGEFNFDIEKLLNPLTNKLIENYYGPKEKFESKFTDISRAYEECRADLCALYFVFFKEIHQIFDFDESVYQDVIYAIWLLYIRKGIIGLPLYDEETKKWGQAHTQGAWIFTNFLLENQHEDKPILSIQFEEKELKINLNK
jgi:dipeptidyl-peptidase-3